MATTTVPEDLEQALALLRSAAGPEQLFGPRTGGDDATVPPEAHRRYRHLARLVHPDRCPEDREAATEAFTRLASLWATYTHTPSAAPVSIATRRNTYTLDATGLRGDLANLYPAQRTPVASRPGRAPTDPDGPRRVLVKMPRDPRNNDLLDNEAEVLKHLAGTTEDRYAAYLPQLVETFRHRDATTGIDRRVNVVGHLEGFHTLADVAAAYPAGLDARDAAWMWRRLLVALGAVHHADVVHGAVLPEHVLIHPAEHGLVLVDFAYATTGGPLTALVPRYRDWYPEEVTAKQQPGPGTDIAMATRCMTHLMGERAPAPLRAFARGCTLRTLRARPHDAWGLLGELDELLERLYGPRTFRPFTMPDPTH